MPYLALWYSFPLCLSPSLAHTYILEYEGFIYLTGIDQQWILHVLAAPIVFGIPYQAWNEIIIEIAKMAREGYITAFVGLIN